MSNRRRRRRARRAGAEAARGLDRLPCGCRMGVRGDAFVVIPCSLTCQFYRYAIGETAAEQKPVMHAVLGEAANRRVVDAAHLETDVELSALLGQPVYPLFEAMRTPEGSVVLEHPAWDVVQALLDPEARP